MDLYNQYYDTFCCVFVRIPKGRYNGQVPTRLVSINTPANTRLAMPHAPDVMPVAYKTRRPIAMMTRIVRSSEPIFFIMTVFFLRRKEVSLPQSVIKITHVSVCQQLIMVSLAIAYVSTVILLRISLTCPAFSNCFSKREITSRDVAKSWAISSWVIDRTVHWQLWVFFCR